MAIFTEKMICSNCKNVYIRKIEQGKFRWVCKNFDDFSNCVSNIVSEEAMIEFISRRLYIDERTLENTTKFIEDKLERIVVKGAYDFMVSIRGQEPMFMKPGHFHY
jgi:hypothetical protein